MEQVFYELSSESLSHIVNWLVRVNGQLPWFREWVNGQLEAREESRRQAREYDLQRRTLKRELTDTEAQIKMLQTRPNLDTDDTTSKELKSAESRARKLTSKISETENLIKDCDTQAFEGVRIEGLGVDRWNRRYWHLADRLWVEIDVEGSEFYTQQQQDTTIVKEEEPIIIDVDEEVLAPDATNATNTQTTLSTPEGAIHPVNAIEGEMGRVGRSSPTCWYQYTRLEHVEALKSYLSPFGLQESELLVALQGLPPTLYATQHSNHGAKDVDMFDDEIGPNVSDAAMSPAHTRKRRRPPPIVDIGSRKSYVNKLR